MPTLKRDYRVNGNLAWLASNLGVYVLNKVPSFVGMTYFISMLALKTQRLHERRQKASAG
jgi:hypothetical protein